MATGIDSSILQYSCLENPLSWKENLEGHSPLGHKELDMSKEILRA